MANPRDYLDSGSDNMPASAPSKLPDCQESSKKSNPESEKKDEIKLKQSGKME